MSAKKSRSSTATPSLYEFAVSPEWCSRTTLSPAQAAVLKGMEADPTATAEERDLFLRMTERTEYPGDRAGNVTVLGGSGGGKDSMIVTPVALWTAFFGGYERQLIAGQVGVYLIIAQNAEAGLITLDYLKGAIRQSPRMMALTADLDKVGEVTLKSGIRILVLPCTHRAARGHSIIGACLNEVSFFRFEGAAESDIEIEASIRRGMRFKGARLLKVTTCYLPEGVAYRDFKRGHGPQNDPVQLTFKAPTELLWPGSAEWVAQVRALWQDPDRARRELDAEFVDASINAFIPRAEVEKCVGHAGDLDYDERHSYVATCDASGLTENDVWTFCLQYEHEGAATVAVLRGFTGTDEREMMSEHAELMKRYRVHDMRLVGDRYAGTLPARMYAIYGINYEPAPWDKSEAYLRTRKIIRRATTGDPGLRLAIPNDETLISQFSRLEVDYREKGKVRVDHPQRKGQHDDYCNVVSLGASLLERGAIFGEVQRAADVRGEVERYGHESWRPDPHPHLGLPCPPDCPVRNTSHASLEALFERVLAKGMKPAALENYKANLPDDKLVVYLQGWLSEQGFRGRMNRAHWS